MDGMIFHPLYELYENILNEELPMYEGINSLKEATSFMDYQMGILNNVYL